MLTFSCAITEKVTKKRVSKKVIFFMDGGSLLLSMNKGTEMDLGCDFSHLFLFNYFQTSWLLPLSPLTIHTLFEPPECFLILIDDHLD